MAAHKFYQHLKHILFCLLSAIIFYSIFTLVFVCLLPFIIFRIICVFIIYRNCRFLDATCAYFLYGQSDQLSVKGNLLLSIQVEGLLSLNSVENYIEEVVENNTELKQFVCFNGHGGFPWWKNDECFRIQDHVLQYAGTNENCQANLDINKIKFDFVNSPWNKNKSPWQILVMHLNNYQTVVFFKFHHALGDGLRLYEAFSKQRQQKNQKSVLSPISNANTVRNSTLWLRNKFMTVLVGPYHLHRALKCQRITTAEWVQNPKSSSCTRKYFSNKINLSKNKIKQVALNQGVSLSTVFTCIISTAIQQISPNTKELRTICVIPKPTTTTIDKINDNPTSSNLFNSFWKIPCVFPVATTNPSLQLQAAETSFQYEKKCMPYCTILLDLLTKVFCILPLAWHYKFTNDTCYSIMLSKFRWPTEEEEMKYFINHKITDVCTQTNFRFPLEINSTSFENSIFVLVNVCKDPIVFRNKEVLDKFLIELEMALDLFSQLPKVSKLSTV